MKRLLWLLFLLAWLCLALAAALDTGSRWRTQQQQPTPTVQEQNCTTSPQEREAQERAGKGIDPAKRKADLKELWKKLPDHYKRSGQKEAVRRQ